MKTKITMSFLMLGVLLTPHLATAASAQRDKLMWDYINTKHANEKKKIKKIALAEVKAYGCGTEILRIEDDYSTTYLETRSCFCYYVAHRDGNNAKLESVETNCEFK